MTQFQLPPEEELANQERPYQDPFEQEDDTPKPKIHPFLLAVIIVSSTLVAIALWNYLGRVPASTVSY